MPNPAVGVGAGMMGIGGFMAEKGNRKQQRLIGEAGDWLMGYMEDLAGETDERYEGLIAQYSDLMMGDESGYTASYNQLTGDLDSMYDTMLTEYTAAREDVRSAYDVGRVNTLAAIEQSTQDAQRRAIASQAFTGMGNTTFGGAQIAGIGTQGALQKGVVEEQYATGMANILGQTAAGRAGIQGQQIATTQGLGSQYMGGMQGYASTLAGLQQSQTGMYANLMAQPAQSVYAGMMQSAQIPTGSGFWGPMIGGIGSGLMSGGMPGGTA